MTCGNLLTYLYSNTSYKAVPNPPAQIQTAINEEVRKFQGILDSIEVEIQLSQRYFKKKQEQKKAQLEAEEDKTAQDNNQQDTNEPEKVESNEDDVSNEVDNAKEAIDEEVDYKKADNDNEMLNDLMDNNNGFGDMEGMVEGFDDFNNLLDAGANGNLERGDGVATDDGMGNDDVGGLFGADFDFMMPTE